MPKSEFYTVSELLDGPNTGRNGEIANKDYMRCCSGCGAAIHNSNSVGLCGDCVVETDGIAQRHLRLVPLTREVTYEAE